jgi:predicted dehydrogenase
MNADPSITRRDFTKLGLLAGLGWALARQPLRAEAVERVQLGFIGVGGRGSGLLRTCLQMPDVDMPAVCDLLPKNLAAAQATVEKSGRPRPEGYGRDELDYLNLLQRDDLHGVIIATPWELHIPMTIAAMKAGKYAAAEVGPASSVEECWELVTTHEQTKVPCMLLENYSFHRTWMALLTMVRQGVFGELIHCQGGYEHDLRGRIVQGKGTGITLPEGGDFRTRHNRRRNGDIYPTHGIGPIAHCLDIERGNRFVSLTSTASKSRGLNAWAADAFGAEDPRARQTWAMGDIVTTVIKCHNGETVVLNHDVALPRPLLSMGRVQGTKGIWERATNSIYLDKRSPKEHTWEPFGPYQDQYEHPWWREYVKSGIKQGHWGTDYLTLGAFAQAAKHRGPVPIDACDFATWRVIAPLSEKSIALGSQPVEFPDFTRGQWRTNQRIFGV